MDAVILASSSPRRQEILRKLNIPFRVMIPEIDEGRPDDVPLEKLPEFLAVQKVNAIARQLQNDQELTWILGADTLVLKDGRTYGKPRDRAEAFQFLRELSGQTHQVLTGVALFNGRLFYLSTRTCASSVTLSPMSDAEIEHYLDSGEWHGAAGAYRIQETGACFIRRIDGSPSGVMGLPISDLYAMLTEQGYSFFE